MRIVIIEDEKPAARLLKRKIEALGYTIQQQLSSVEEGLDWFDKNEHPDLIFVDIQLSDGLSFEIFESIPIQSAVIFTTAYDEYALKAFKLNSVDYLLKPIDEHELEMALLKFKSRYEKKYVDIELMKNLLKRQNKERYTVKVGNTLKIIESDYIQCFYSANKISYLSTLEGRNYFLDDTLDALESECDNKKFFRVNRQFIININAVKEISIYTNSRLKITLQNFKEEEIIVSREKVAAFKNWIS